MVVKGFIPTHRERAPEGGVVCTCWRVGRYIRIMSQAIDGPGFANATWWPDLPRKLTATEWRQYRDGRDRHHQQLANVLGGVVMAVDL